MPGAHTAQFLRKKIPMVEAVTIIGTETRIEIENKPFTVYRIQVTTARPAQSWIVAKRFSDFVELRRVRQHSIMEHQWSHFAPAPPPSCCRRRR
jgi:hypothetical protein